jgi:hypothetical protein
MSARAVKRLLAQQQRKAEAEEVEEVKESSEEETAGVVGNPFDLLGNEVNAVFRYFIRSVRASDSFDGVIVNGAVFLNVLVQGRSSSSSCLAASGCCVSLRRIPFISCMFQEHNLHYEYPVVPFLVPLVEQ